MRASWKSIVGSAATLACLLSTNACDAQDEMSSEAAAELVPGRSAPAMTCSEREGRREFYVLDAINDQLDDNEALRTFSGLEHVETCEDARQFVRLKQAFLEQQDEAPDLTQEDYPLEDQPRIANGSTTSFQPSVELVISEGEGWTETIQCSGFIIGPKEIVTAAHCIYADKKRPVRVRVRENVFGVLSTQCVANCNSNTPNAQGYRHPNYTGLGDSGDDIGVFVFDDPLPDFATTSVDKVRLMTTKTWDNAPIQVYGWGRDTQLGGSGVAREGEMTVSYSGATHFTANADQSRVCKGDSGGAATRNSVSESPFAVGVASEMVGSVGPGCPYSDGFNRWAHIGPKMRWIEGRIGRTCAKFTSSTNAAIKYARCW